MQEVAEKQARVNELQKGEKDQREKVEELQAERIKLEQESEALTKEIANHKWIAEQFATAANQLARGQVVIPVSQVFAERRLPPRPSAAMAEDALKELLSEGKKAVSEFGAEDVALAPVSIEAGSQQTWLNQDQIMALLINHLATFDVPVSVRLLAARNHFAGEAEIMSRMETIPIREAFSRGELITSTTVDGKQGDARIFNQLLTLVNEGEKVSRERRVMPPLTPDNPHFFAEGTNERIFEALRQIQAVKGPTTVRLVAAEDISTVDRVNVRLEVGSP